MLFRTTRRTSIEVKNNSQFIRNSADELSQLSEKLTALATAGTLSAANFRSSATDAASDANDYILYNTTSGALLYDADGNGSGAAVQFATPITKPPITASDCMVVA